jgi:hypothetical protein
MGMYTEFHFNVEMKQNLPEQVVATLAGMCGDQDLDHVERPDHPFFQCQRWAYLFRHDSYYFDADTHSTFRFDEISDAYYLCVRSNLKNYGGEIQHFLDWIPPYLDKLEGDFLGFYRYEQSESPVLIYYGVSGIETARTEGLKPEPLDLENL